MARFIANLKYAQVSCCYSCCFPFTLTTTTMCLGKYHRYVYKTFKNFNRLYMVIFEIIIHLKKNIQVGLIMFYFCLPFWEYVVNGIRFTWSSSYSFVIFDITPSSSSSITIQIDQHFGFHLTSLICDMFE